MKLLRTIRFDQSDDHVYAVAAAADEWAVSGGFAFSGIDPGALTGKTRQAFANGFLGLGSFGRSTFAAVAECDDATRDDLVGGLAQHFVDAYGAPDVDLARPAAREEIDFVAELCDAALINTVFTVRRTLDEEGEVREAFRTIQPPTDKPAHARVWAVVDDDE